MSNGCISRTVGIATVAIRIERQTGRKMQGYFAVEAGALFFHNHQAANDSVKIFGNIVLNASLDMLSQRVTNVEGFCRLSESA